MSNPLSLDVFVEIDGFPAVDVGRASGRSELPAWAFQPDDLPTGRIQS